VGANAKSEIVAALVAVAALAMALEVLVLEIGERPHVQAPLIEEDLSELLTTESIQIDRYGFAFVQIDRSLCWTDR
jgi:hypothetical protein